MKKTGIFLCKCKFDVVKFIDFKKVAEELHKFDDVFVMEILDLCSGFSARAVKEAVESHGLEGIVFTSCAPGIHGDMLVKSAEKAGLKKEQVRVAELKSLKNGNGKSMKDWTNEVVESILKAKTRLEKGKLPDEVRNQVIKKALVIGGGVAGIHAALDIANGGYEVLLVEKSPSIGGHMVQISEVFPTLDCPQCILTPKMVATNQHPKIKILANTELEKIQGSVGNFKAVLRHKSPYVDWSKCTGCGECMRVCTCKFPSIFDREVVKQTAIHKPFAQAVPNKATIVKKGISPCKGACPLGCNAQGYVALIGNEHFDEALKMIRETVPFPGIMGRICAHPCEEQCKRIEEDAPINICRLKRFAAEMKRDKELAFEVIIPEAEANGKRVAVIGGGPAGLLAAFDLRKKGYKVSIFEKDEKIGGILRWGFPPYRLPQEVVDRELKIIPEIGIEIKTGIMVGKDISLEEIKSEYDAVFIAVGLKGVQEFMAAETGLSKTRMKTLKADPLTLETNMKGVFSGGDMVTGANTVVYAMATGRRGAESIDRYLRGVDLREGRREMEPPVSEFPVQIDGIRLRERERVHHMLGEEEPLFSVQDAVKEAQKCLSCGGCAECFYCETACEAKAIDHNIKDWLEEVEVGAVVVATGYELLGRDLIPEYQRDPDILDPLQFERLLAPSGPTTGQILRPSDGKTPKDLVFVSCAGSRDPEHHMPYCSRVCCLYNCKMGMLYKHVVHDGRVYIFYIDVRTDGKMYEEFYQRGVEEDRILYLRGKVSRIYRKGEKLVVRGSDTLSGKQVEIEADMVVLSLAMISRPETAELVKKLGLETNEWGFIREAHPQLKPVESTVPGIFLAGTCQAPREIPECVAHAAGCAGKVLSLFAQNEVAFCPEEE